MDILEQLRAETRGDHDALEEIGVSQKIMDGSMQPDEYKRLIKVQYLLHKVLEDQLEEAGIQDLFPDLHYEERQKMPLIMKDLQELGISQEELKEFPPAGSVPEISIPFGLLGCMYVLEGATLGGMVIVKSLKKNQNLSGIDNFHYFGCYGGETGPQWKHFLQVLQQEGNKPEAKDQVVLAAKETYRFFRNNFKEYLND